MLDLLGTWLEKAGHCVECAFSGEAALEQLAKGKPDLVVSDLYMSGMDGLTLLSEIHQRDPLLPVIMLSGQAQIPDAVKATHLGSSAFLTKPIGKEDFIAAVSRTLELHGGFRTGQSFGANLVYRSRAMTELMEHAALVAQSDITVFISGDTGAGKEMLAKAIHEASPRASAPFIGVNCGAIPEQLLESELFGHEKGAFTGANTRHEGLFQAADGGTLFLDEIGDMPLGLQVKLLRVLQDFAVRPVGSVTSVPINVRVISATHQDLDEMVGRGEFREDLYYRLNVVPLHMPSLGERRDDIPLLVEHFLARIGQRLQRPRKRLATDAMQLLSSAAWPGNVRQLVNVVEQCVALTPGDSIPATMVERALRHGAGAIKSLKEAKDEFERNYLVSVLRITEGNVANAARVAGRNRTEFYKLLNQHGLDAGEFRPGTDDT
ncbi:MAG: sigma 54-interacting transcriptional regulator [Gammaproteobacteria bacterium]|nr:sigma 54-interacting transcriptional regulator [Gammaproteobacteria bacterium]